ncbi:hypothetical protein [Nitrosarchaeum sp. AC2]|uniref:hypothetical protein n=1 Tax=Nitrosarchaeum sp. AC2 TaxID=2259673 RepID=UPI0015CB996A|nr:hypothetical protein [Nitrosarchaeum sp. AC2]QLH11016.1 hypothetical protein DSQ20_05685 [Nitrosarchaeum sp. AC2]
MKYLVIALFVTLFLNGVLMAYGEQPNSNNSEVIGTYSNGTISIQVNLDSTNSNHVSWNEGDVLIASTTIVAFLGFGSFISLKFETDSKYAQLIWLRVILGSIGVIIFIHIHVIIFIIQNNFDTSLYTNWLYLTIIFIILILISINEIVRLESKGRATKSTFSLIRDTVQKNIEEQIAADKEAAAITAKIDVTKYDMVIQNFKRELEILKNNIKEFSTNKKSAKPKNNKNTSKKSKRKTTLTKRKK